MSMEQGRLDWVQALRGIAAMLVVLCHAADYLRDSPSYPLIESALLPGAMGVDLFFIISGFIMVYSTRKATGTMDDVKNFAISRFSRIWPTYAVVSLLWIFIAYSGLAYFSSTENLTALLKSLTFIPVKEMAPLYFEPVFPLGWTLNFEMYFYVVFAVSLLFKRFRLAAMLTWIALTVVLIPILTRTFSTDPFTYYSYEFNYLNLITNPIILEFVAGALIGYMYLSKHIIICSKVVAVNLLASSVALVVWFNYSGPASTHGITNWGGSTGYYGFSYGRMQQNRAYKITQDSNVAWKNILLVVPDPLSDQGGHGSLGGVLRVERLYAHMGVLRFFCGAMRFGCCWLSIPA